MNQLHAGALILLCALLGACATGAGSSGASVNMPRASLGDFTDHVLEPLALRIADEKISQAMGERKLARTPKSPAQTLAGLLAELPWVGKLMTVTTASQKAKLEEELVWLETRRIPLKRELVDLFVSRTTQEGEIFTVCADGVERRYQAFDVGRFSRLPDGPGPCAIAPLLSLERQT